MRHANPTSRQGAVAPVKIGERVAALLRDSAGVAICDDCIAKELGLPRRQEAQAATAALSATREFTRSRGQCSRCSDSRDKLVIRAI
jgi:hypothetical protein